MQSDAMEPILTFPKLTKVKNVRLCVILSNVVSHHHCTNKCTVRLPVPVCSTPAVI